jgi:hypothetical protein
MRVAQNNYCMYILHPPKGSRHNAAIGLQNAYQRIHSSAARIAISRYRSCILCNMLRYKHFRLSEPTALATINFVSWSSYITHEGLET